ncbi:uncharacterized protein MYCFIDRAFT_175865 [Pseudocercospora fijiensis CIRAD86]|uniref:Uncharacterized protein n=1 Tax=Pseudocercospora fijiensis (strain CIRAD86) TaxID=383855 RepID=M3AYQ8_PSEFD|nr:uncharacterized protein MYCFIDRAFT_175865 [Pseudocercospora fijiensis CIRAD86]EME82322.1 hypothetical protein MYCFIDRAFT_175865 [Pseudocercospora fijiensis CIRAD86]
MSKRTLILLSSQQQQIRPHKGEGKRERRIFACLGELRLILCRFFAMLASSIRRTIGMELLLRVGDIRIQESRKDPGNTAFDSDSAKTACMLNLGASRAHTSLWKAVVAVKEQENLELGSASIARWHIGVKEPSGTTNCRRLGYQYPL